VFQSAIDKVGPIILPKNGDSAATNSDNNKNGTPEEE
jgi:hypothetical protein